METAPERLEAHRCFGGTQLRLGHDSAVLGCPMNFSLFLPPQAASGPVPVLWWLSGLTCTDENFVQKAGAQRHAAALGLAIVCPDTSPRGLGLPGEDEDWDFGTGAGYYVNATQAPWAAHYRMYDYVTAELPALVRRHFPLAPAEAISGHSMGGHGALVCALRQPGRYAAVSALAPISHPSAAPWGRKAFGRLLGQDESAWTDYDACALIERGARLPALLVDQGEDDPFREAQLMPERLRAVCEAAGQPLQLRLQPGYDHSYFFVATFIDAHLAHAAHGLGLG